MVNIRAQHVSEKANNLFVFLINETMNQFIISEKSGTKWKIAQYLRRFSHKPEIPGSIPGGCIFHLDNRRRNSTVET